MNRSRLSANNRPEEKYVQVKRLQPRGLNVRVVSGQVLYSHVVTVTGGTHVFIAGQLARDADGNLVGRGDVRAQIEQVGKNVQQCLAAAGARLEDLVKTTTYVTDIEEFFKHADIRMRYFGPALPTSTTVEVRRLSHPDFMVEVEAVAVIDDE
jgi:enamine deaminase RidA (YjgF/YER057c/UK114 family)